MLSGNDNIPSPLWQKAVKRLLDILISIVGLILLFPALMLIALGVMFSSKGPVIYKQERIGLKRRKFSMYKFRSMYIDAERYGPRLADTHDSRVTPWGRTMRRWKLDELPQLVNVLVGQMSIVGPRPEREYYINQLEKEQQPFEHLLEVKPGLTSLGIIRYGYAGSVDEMAERMKYDLEYVEKRSIVLDVKIIMDTVKVIVAPKVK